MYNKFFHRRNVVIISFSAVFGLLILAGVWLYPQRSQKQVQVQVKVEAEVEPKCFWELSINSNKPGGVEVKKKQNMSSCMNECISKKGCQSFDYTSVKVGLVNCWLQFKNNTFPIDYSNVVDVVHYEKVCPTEGQNLKKNNNRNCEWTENKDIRGSEGMLMQGVTSLEKCKEACLMAWNCAGINWNENEFEISNKCSLTTKHAFMEEITGIRHLSRKCDCSWWAYKGTSAVESNFQTSIKTFKGCKNTCYADPLCNTFDWNSLQKSCFFAVSSETIEQFGVNHYVYECHGV